MSFKTVEEIHESLNEIENLKRELFPIGIALFKLKYGDNKHIIDRVSIENFDANDITFEENGEAYLNIEYYSCGESETIDIKIPFEYLFDDEWLKKAEEKVRKMEEEKRKKKEEELLKKETEDKNKRYNKYLKLKEEFENV